GFHRLSFSEMSTLRGSSAASRIPVVSCVNRVPYEPEPRKERRKSALGRGSQAIRRMLCPGVGKCQGQPRAPLSLCADRDIRAMTAARVRFIFFLLRNLASSTAPLTPAQVRGETDHLRQIFLKWEEHGLSRSVPLPITLRRKSHTNPFGFNKAEKRALS